MGDITNWAAGLTAIGGIIAGWFKWVSTRKSQELDELHRIIAELRQECSRRQQDEKTANEDSSKWKQIADKLQRVSNRQSLECFLYRKAIKDARDDLKYALTIIKQDGDGCERVVLEVIERLQQDVRVPDEADGQVG